jgi:hypothetical protein
MDSGKKFKSHNSNFLKRKTNTLDKNEFDDNINKKVKSDNLIIRKEILHSQTFKGFYISEDNEIKEKTKGSIKEFKNVLGSNNCNIFSIDNGYKILYCKNSKSVNKYLSTKVPVNEIKGNIIIFNTDKSKQKISIKEISRILSNPEKLWLMPR